MIGKLGYFCVVLTGGAGGNLSRPNGWSIYSDGESFTSIRRNSNFLTATSIVQTLAVSPGNLSITVSFATQGADNGGVLVYVNDALRLTITDGTNGSTVTLSGTDGNPIFAGDVVRVDRVKYDSALAQYVLDEAGYTSISYIELYVS
jgi:hypothetical protein